MKIWVIKIEHGEYTDRKSHVMRRAFRTQEEAQAEVARLALIVLVEERCYEFAARLEDNEERRKAIAAWHKAYWAAIPEELFVGEDVGPIFSIHEVEIVENP